MSTVEPLLMRDSLDKVLEDLTLSQLVDIALLLRPETRKGGLSGKNRSYVLDELNHVTDRQKLELAAHKVEMVSPHKHLLPLRKVGDWDYKKLKTAISAAYPSLVNQLDSSNELPLYDVIPELCVFDDENERAYIKLNHQVEAYRWEKVSEDERLRRRFRRRHPITVCFRTSIQVVSVEFMGYSQISIDREPVRYDKLATQIINMLQDSANIKLIPCELRTSIEALLRNPDSKVIDFRHSLQGPSGRMVFASSAEEQSVSDFLQSYLRSKGINITAQESRQILAGDETDNKALLWQEYEVLTRISFENPISEILFVWRGSDPSIQLVETILKKLSTEPLMESKEELSLDSFIANLNIGDTIRPAFVARKLALTEEVVITDLVRAVKKKQLSLRFRLRGSFQEEVENPWHASMSSLRPLEAVDGHVIDPTDLKNVEIGFRREAVA